MDPSEWDSRSGFSAGASATATEVPAAVAKHEPDVVVGVAAGEVIFEPGVVGLLGELVGADSCRAPDYSTTPNRVRMNSATWAALHEWTFRSGSCPFGRGIDGDRG